MKLALLSKNVILPEYLEPQHAVIFIQDQIIQQVKLATEIELSTYRQEYLIEDLGELFISPGIIDLNVYLEQDGGETLLQACSGGVTTIGTHSQIQEELYTDVVRFKELNDNELDLIEDTNQFFAFKAFLVPQGPNHEPLRDLERALQLVERHQLPCFFHTEYIEQEQLDISSPYRMISYDLRDNLERKKQELIQKKLSEEVSPNKDFSRYRSTSIFEILERKESLEPYNDEDIAKISEIKPFDDSCEEESNSSSDSNSDQDSDQDFNIITNNPLNPIRFDAVGAKRRTSLKCRAFINPFDEEDKVPYKKRLSVPDVSQTFKFQANRRSSCLQSQNAPKMQKASEIKRLSMEEYSLYLTQFPETWEINAVNKVCKAAKNREVKIHFTNISSSKAVINLNQYSKNFTCDTSVPYLYYHQGDVLPGDARFKTNPPIRDSLNHTQLWNCLKLRQINCISSFHQAIPPYKKLLTSFKLATNGISSIGFSLQAIWTRLRQPLTTEEQERKYLSHLSTWMSSMPAKILGIDSFKGEISAGKQADLIIWDPFEKEIAQNKHLKYPEMCPYIGEEITGIIYRTYLRGQLVFSSEGSTPAGTILTRSNNQQLHIFQEIVLMGVCNGKVKNNRIKAGVSEQISRYNVLNYCKIYTVTYQELKFLSQLFNELAHHSDYDDAIDKKAFLMYFPLPVNFTQGLWGERVFEKFDENGNGCIDYTEMITGLAIFTKGEEDQKYRFLFKLFDLRDRNLIDKGDFTQMIFNYQDMIQCFPECNQTDDDMLQMNQEKSELFLQLRSPVFLSRKCLKRAQSETTNDISDRIIKIQTIVEMVYSKYCQNEMQMLNFQEFAILLNEHQKIIFMFEKNFNIQQWKNQNQHLKQSLHRLHTSNTNQMMPVNKNFSGYTYKQIGKFGRMAQFWTQINSSLLMLYEQQQDEIPSYVIFLEGLSLQSLGTKLNDSWYGIRLYHDTNQKKDTYLWYQTVKERNNWLRQLSIYTNTRKFKQMYQIIRRIGQGKLSVVYKVQSNETQQQYAAKVIAQKNLKRKDKEQIRMEIAIMKILHHPGVINLIDIFRSKGSLVLILEYIKGGNLKQYLENWHSITERKTKHIVHQLLDILSYLHDSGIIHRDIKPENILILKVSEEPQIKLADFGLSKFIKPESKLNQSCGTLGYIAPEVLRGDQYDNKADIWSVGAIAYQMLRGKLPYEHRDRNLLITLTIETSINWYEQYWDNFNPLAKDFLQRLLSKNPKQRLSAKEAMQHPWLMQNSLQYSSAEQQQSSDNLESIPTDQTPKYNHKAGFSEHEL